MDAFCMVTLVSASKRLTGKMFFEGLCHVLFSYCICANLGTQKAGYAQIGALTKYSPLWISAIRISEIFG
jgi:hypothetical protein